MEITATDTQKDQSAISLKQRQQLVLVAIGFALAWWLIGLMLYRDPSIHGDLLYIWGDQKWTFMKADRYLFEPYMIPGFLNPPWVIFILAPFASIPFIWGVLAQMILYYVGLALVIAKYGGGMRTLILLALSPLALNTMIEINVDWMVVWALLLPPAYCGPLLLAKPQDAIGYLLSFKWHELVRWVLVMLLVGLATLLIWGDWPLAWMDSTGIYLGVLPNMAPQGFLGRIPALIIGVGFSLYAWRKRDPVLGIFAGMFFAPYLASYSIFLHYSLFLARWQKAGVILWIASWVSVIILAVTLLLL